MTSYNKCSDIAYIFKIASNFFSGQASISFAYDPVAWKHSTYSFPLCNMTSTSTLSYYENFKSFFFFLHRLLFCMQKHWARYFYEDSLTCCLV
jgi:hypothetical protein